MIAQSDAVRLRRGRIAKRAALLGQLVASALAFLAWSQTWFRLTIGTDAGPASLDVPGAAASPALAALGLAGLALVTALTIAGAVIRVILGLLGIALGTSILVASIGPVADPVAAGAATIGSSTGVAGSGSVHALVLASSATAWPAVAIAAGVLVALCGAAVLVTGAIWPMTGRRYQAVVFESEQGSRSSDPAELVDQGGDSAPPPADSAAADRAAAAAAGRPGDAAVEDWDRLTAGQDPTTRPEAFGSGPPPRTR